jgi:hypothetical protein
MRFQISAAVVVALLIVAAPLLGQTSDSADKRAGSWFNNDRDVYVERTKTLDGPDLDAWVMATTTTFVFKRDELYFVMPTFDPLWDAKTNKMLPGAVAKFAKRLEQLPVTAVEDWEKLTGADAIYAATSLIAENTLFPREKFDASRFQSFKAKYSK